eukprot:NODE_3541_length_762_cov_64.398317_g2965_i0.p2 GENE.NODE_3541_length_762_cov_64.398317_g2965_i0~~NODE_3541_length_762_cov_64.398317_g2965_i0.p2  ORF type:complete len:175 (-),score=42.87 NODE_3541_length_762_cov_64.398317_g2965_i0:211-735(-)
MGDTAISAFSPNGCTYDGSSCICSHTTPFLVALPDTPPVIVNHTTVQAPKVVAPSSSTPVTTSPSSSSSSSSSSDNSRLLFFILVATGAALVVCFVGLCGLYFWYKFQRLEREDDMIEAEVELEAQFDAIAKPVAGAEAGYTFVQHDPLITGLAPYPSAQFHPPTPIPHMFVNY